MQKLLQQLQQKEIEIHKVITTATQQGGAITFSINDAIRFIYALCLENEINYINFIVNSNELTQYQVESFLKHLLFATQTAKKFVAWQRRKD